MSHERAPNGDQAVATGPVAPAGADEVAGADEAAGGGVAVGRQSGINPGEGVIDRDPGEEVPRSSGDIGSAALPGGEGRRPVGAAFAECFSGGAG